MTHPELVKALVKPGKSILESTTPVKADLTHMALGVAGEAGEIVDCIKKYTIYNKELDMQNLIEELGDMEFFLERIRQILNVTREHVLEHNIDKLTKRYGEKYSDAAAQARADKQ